MKTEEACGKFNMCVTFPKWVFHCVGFDLLGIL